MTTFSLKITVFTIFSLFTIYHSTNADSLHTRTITDMAERKITIPAVIKSVYSTSPAGEIMMYTLAPSKITGTTWTLDNEEKSLLTEEYLKKPVLGGWFGKNTTGNPEVIIKAHPDIVLSVGFVDNTDISAVKRIEEALGIPVVMVNGKLDSVDAAYKFLGRITGDSLRADSLAAYCRTVLDNISSITSKIPADKRIKVYYAEGLNGLETDPEGSMHTEILGMAGGINVADIPLLKGFGRATVSFEQLLIWQPQFIIVCMDHSYAHGTENYSKIISDNSWRVIEAVKSGSIYQIPSIPFNWFDRPPSVNRIIGLQWLSNLLYPSICKLDIKDVTEKFYKLFYHRELTGSELNRVLMNSIRK